jgi:hypothetical protein
LKERLLKASTKKLKDIEAVISEIEKETMQSGHNRLRDL